MFYGFIDTVSKFIKEKASLFKEAFFGKINYQIFYIGFRFLVFRNIGIHINFIGFKKFIFSNFKFQQ